eukprot:scaffold3119_cov20-Tisochrysis_lutea.AAC.1
MHFAFCPQFTGDNVNPDADPEATAADLEQLLQHVRELSINHGPGQGSGTEQQSDQGTASLLFPQRGSHTVILSYCHTVILSYCHVSHTAILSYCHVSHTAILSYCHTVILPYCHVSHTAGQHATHSAITSAYLRWRRTASRLLHKQSKRRSLASRSAFARPNGLRAPKPTVLLAS